MQISSIDTLIQHFARLPGLGPRSARRLVLHLIRQRERALPPLIASLQQVLETIRACGVCGNLDVQSPCHLCADPRRDGALLCVVEEVGDLWAIERCHLYKGRYHVLGGTLSAMDDRGPEKLNVETLVARAAQGVVKEVILATNATVEGQTTAHYLTNRLKDFGVEISRLAQGIPMGGELDYLDDGTLGAALSARLPF
ncbi:MAG: recombination protein RecR [Alphaproteobacteria bacterium]|nr:recombination protein RecR [Alphaproteobacteria bacterium]